MIRVRSTVFLALPVVAFVLTAPAVAQQLTPPTHPSTRATTPSKPKPQPQRQAPAPAPVPGVGQPQLLGQFGAWGAYTANPGGRKVCFALAKPMRSETNPPRRPRDPTFLFISSRPSERVKDEVSVIFGYGFKPSADATIEVGGANFPMYTQADGGWIKNAAEEPRLVESMRHGDMVVKGVSVHGTSSTDLYTTKGLAQALDRVAQECR